MIVNGTQVPLMPEMKSEFHCADQAIMKRRQLKGPEVEKEEIKFPLFVDGLADYVEEYSTLLELIMKFGMIPGFRIEEKTKQNKKSLYSKQQQQQVIKARRWHRSEPQVNHLGIQLAETAKC